ncbi:hypothetical protein D081_2291 [Anaerovibrio sp. JC8]|uniref:DUF2939 domain-containing protein n=1 Tax=Anaerovibrio sp. JC8 TaxID=1240085 RepID=UPI000A0DAA74|nr:DUF2939 domain-containing protein [Anaerovibrio sp. JC8]ORT98926.1 hypothetical protein D081_2291 [Anaerovibrio sp. JC8]
MNYKGALIIGIFLEILLAGAAAAFYFLYYVHTPAYSMNALQSAVHNHNAEEFQKYVDLDALLNKGANDLSNLIEMDSPDKQMILDGSLVQQTKEDILYFVTNEKWPKEEDVSQATAFQDKIGLRTMFVRKVEYVSKDPVIELEEGDEEAEPAGPPTATVAVRVFEPNYGDSFVLKFKMRQMEDETWQIYDILNYAEFVDALIKQNERDMKRYVDKVRTNLKNTEDKFAELKKKMPEINKDWIIEAEKIMKESCEGLDELKVPVAGKHLESLLDQRKSIFYDMMDDYYASVNHQEKVEDYKKLQEELMKRDEERKKQGIKVKKRREPNFEAMATRINEQVSESNKRWEENKAEIAKIIGPSEEVRARGVRAMRNNDDAAVRAANYPGADAEVGMDFSPVRAENLPEVSVYNEEKTSPPR